MDRPTLTTRQKALALNLDARTYGTFAEIGGGQEVARAFFAAGGAAGTVAKSISAYDMAVSDRSYPPLPPPLGRCASAGERRGGGVGVAEGCDHGAGRHRSTRSLGGRSASAVLPVIQLERYEARQQKHGEELARSE